MILFLGLREKGTKSPEKETKSPEKEKQSPEKETKSPEKEKQSPAREKRSQAGAAKPEKKIGPRKKITFFFSRASGGSRVRFRAISSDFERASQRGRRRASPPQISASPRCPLPFRCPVKRSDFGRRFRATSPTFGSRPPAIFPAKRPARRVAKVGIVMEYRGQR